jgi:uncharacterized protein
MSGPSKPPFTSPVIPVQFEGDHQFNFRCYKGISCFNACCKSIDITLTPYDIIRLRRRFGITSGQFLKEYTAPFEMEKDGMAGVKLRTVGDTTQCQFMTDEGCSVYEDRPTACRYYPVGLISMRRQDEYVDRATYAIVREDHCTGHNEDRPITIDEYRAEQGVAEYDEYARGWRQLILKKKSSGPTIGTPSLRSRRLFFTANYDIDTFRAFVESSVFQESFVLDQGEDSQILASDENLLEFGYRLLRQVLFGEMTIKVRDQVKQEVIRELSAEQAAIERAAADARRRHDVPVYRPDLDVMELMA